jgi:paraquat-inducible protein B
MTDEHRDPDIADIPAAVAEPKRHRSLQLVWLIPIVAAIIGGTLAVRTYLQKGPTITITFKTGEGLEAGKTKIKYRDVDIGLVKEIAIAKDRQQVLATAEINKDAKPFLVEDTKFWVVKPRISGGTVSGLGTLLGGSYIGVDVGKSEQPRREFKGLEIPPVVSMDVPGSRFLLHATDLGSLDTGSPIYFRRIQVGQVISYKLDEGGTGVSFKIFVAAPYDSYVKSNTRFWHASGIDVSLDAGGLKVQTQSLVSILLGGIAFQILDEAEAAVPVGPNTTFELYVNRDDAMKHRDAISHSYVLVFKESLRGLAVGAPVEFRGLPVGEVTGIGVAFDRRLKEINMLVDVRVYPERLRSRAIGKLPGHPRQPQPMLNAMIGSGLRAQLQTGNLLTGQLFVALDFFPNAPKEKIDWSATPPQVPTMPSSMTELQATITRFSKKLDQLPLDELVAELREAIKSFDTTFQSANQMVKRVDADVVPELKSALEEARKALAAAKQTLASDSPLQEDLREALRELARAAQSLRVLTDYLDRHPESLIRGKPEDKP